MHVWQGAGDRIRSLIAGGIALRVLVAVCGAAYAVRGPDPDALGWAITVTALVVLLVPGRFVIPAAIVQAILLGAAETVRPEIAVIPKVAVAFTVTAAALHSRAGAVLSAAAGTIAYAAALFVPGGPGAGGVLFRFAVGVGGPLLIAAYLRSIERERATATLLAAEAERRRDLAETTARITERAAIARELHDIVAHHVASLVLRVGVAREVLTPTDPRISSVLDDVYSSASVALADTKRLLSGLRAGGNVGLHRALLSPAEFPAALTSLVERVRAGGMEITLTTGGRLDELDDATALAGLRLVQECVTNAVKHGAASTLDLDVAQTPSRGLTVRATNPFAPPIAPTPDRMGVLGMRERVALLSGTMTVTVDDGIWEVRIDIPGPTDCDHVPAKGTK